MTRSPLSDNTPVAVGFFNSLANAHANEAVVSGCTPSKGSGDFDVDIAGGEVVVGGTQVSVSSGTETLSAAASSDRVDIIHVDNTGAISSTEGTPATDPTTPDIPSGEVLVASVLVEGGASSLSSAGSRIDDYRTVVVNGDVAKTVSSATTTADEDYLACDVSGSALTVSLATADAYLGKRITVADASDNAATNNITVDTEGSETIDPGGASSKSITVDSGWAEFIWDGSNWVLLNGNLEVEKLTAGQVDNDDYHETVSTDATVTGATDIDVSAANFFDHTLTGDVTYSFTNVSSSPAGNSFYLEVTQDGTGGRSITWPSSVEWPNGTTPTLDTTAGATNGITFTSHDGGTTWRGTVRGEAFA